MITKDIPTLQIHKLTQAQYDRELAAGNIDDNAIYLTPDEKIPNSDWNQNDETAADYIKNRPFGKYEDEIIDHEETFTGFNYIESGNYYRFMADSPHTDIIFDQPNDFIVYFDGIRYEVTKGAEHSTVSCSVGNYSIVDNTQEDTGEPFFITVDIDLVAGGYLFDTFYTTLEGDSHTIKIAHVGEVIEQLPIEYLPEHTHVWNDIEDRPFGEFEGEVVDHEETLDTFSDDGSGIYTTGSGTLGYLLGPSVLPDDCIVYFDGVRYETKHIYNDYGWLGNQSLADSTLENTGEPFCIKFLGMPEDAYNTIYTTLEGTSHTYKIAHMSETVVKIPEKYLPEISSLPPVTSDDKGKVLAVEDDGNWGAGTVTLKITDDGNGNLSVVLGVVKTIMFAINTMGSSIAEYTAEQNMTWAEWCDSKYNTIGAFIKNNQVMLSDDYYVKEYIQSVLPTDIIEVGHTYDHFISVMS